MKVEIVPQAQLADRSATLVATTLRAAVDARGRATVAFSGGSTAGPLLAALAEADVPWEAIEVFQVDERVAPAGHLERNLTTLRQQLVDHIPLPDEALHPMPVEDADLEAAADRYAELLRDVAGSPPRLDLVHLGLGTDGHTASLLPGSPLAAPDSPLVGTTRPYEGWRRMTLTLPALSHARNILWFVSGASKNAVVPRLARGDRSIPAGRVERSRARLLLDPAAAHALLHTAATTEDTTP